MKSVDSAAIRKVGYDAATRELHIEFHSGHTYTYSDVAPEQQQALVNAESIGRHFAEHVRPHFAGSRRKAA